MDSNKNTSDSSVQGYFILLIAVFTWSFSEIIVILLRGSVGALSLSFFRFFIGGLFLLFILIIKNDLSGIKEMIKNNWHLLLISSCFALGISNVIYFIGVTHTQANIAAIIYTTYPIWIMIYSFFILNERNNIKIKFLGIMIGFLGVLILMTNFNLLGFFSSKYLFGNVLVLIGSIIWGLYSVIGKKIQLNEKDLSNAPLKFATISSLFASIPILVILLFTPERDGFLNYDVESWFWIAFMGIICTGIGIFLLFEGIIRLEVSKGFSLAFLKPIFVMFLAYFILSEEPTIALYISLCLIVVSIILINANPKYKEKRTISNHKD